MDDGWIPHHRIVLDRRYQLFSVVHRFPLFTLDCFALFVPCKKRDKENVLSTTHRIFLSIVQWIDGWIHSLAVLVS
jgi:hypothetical protein